MAINKIVIMIVTIVLLEEQNLFKSFKYSPFRQIKKENKKRIALDELNLIIYTIYMYTNKYKNTQFFTKSIRLHKSFFYSVMRLI